MITSNIQLSKYPSCSSIWLAWKEEEEQEDFLLSKGSVGTKRDHTHSLRILIKKEDSLVEMPSLEPRRQFKFCQV